MDEGWAHSFEHSAIFSIEACLSLSQIAPGAAVCNKNAARG
jgi:hypothetical protein